MRSTRSLEMLPTMVACLLVAGWVGIAAASSAPTPSPGGVVAAAPRRHPSLQDSPGYYPAEDPEANSDGLGRRASAPLTNHLFHGGARSLDELGRSVCRALHHRDADSLYALCIRDDEFRDILWREFPQSRPATGLGWKDGWRILNARLHGGTVGAIHDHGGHYYEFLRFERADTTARYRNFRLHNGLVLVARNDEGGIERFTWLRSVAERRGRFKIYSLED